MSKSEILYHLFDMLNSPVRAKTESGESEYSELYNKIIGRYEMLYNRKTCHVYAKQCATIGVLSEYFNENVEKIDRPTCVDCGGCKRFTGR